VIGGDGVVADQQREEEHAAGLDVVRVDAEGAEHGTRGGLGGRVVTMPDIAEHVVGDAGRR
jgi:hypothetical protein